MASDSVNKEFISIHKSTDSWVCEHSREVRTISFAIPVERKKRYETANSRKRPRRITESCMCKHLKAVPTLSFDIPIEQEERHEVAKSRKKPRTTAKKDERNENLCVPKLKTPNGYVPPSAHELSQLRNGRHSKDASGAMKVGFGGSKNNSASTPDDLLAALHSHFKFDFDPCPLECNVDSLQLESWGKMNFVNPPYSNLLKKKFLEKALEEYEKKNYSVFLIPFRGNRKYWLKYIWPNASEIWLINGTVTFKEYDLPFPQPLCLVVFGKKRKPRRATAVSLGNYDFMVIIP